MPTIRIPKEHWGRVWFALLERGPVGRISKDYIYVVSDEQVRFLRRKNLPFELLPSDNGQSSDVKHG
jgi:hypothetical protein